MMYKGIKVRFLLFFLCAIILISGCAKKPDKEVVREDIPEMEQKIVSFNLANYAGDGSKKWELKGDSADIMAEIIYLTNVAVSAYEEPKMELTSDKGNYNKEDRIVFLDKNVLLTTSNGLKLITDSIEWNGVTDIISTSCPVRIERADVVATGLGAKAFPEMKKIMLNEDVEVLLLQDAMGGTPLELKEELEEEEESKVVINCDGPLEIDYENNIAIFRNNVKVDDKRGQIYSEVMEAYLDPVSKSIYKVIAEGGVKVVRDKDSTYSERALYTTADQKIVLLGKPKIFIHADEEIESIEQDIDRKKIW